MPELNALLQSVEVDARTVLAAPVFLLGVAKPPTTSGVYILTVAGKTVYVGSALGSKGLKDRLLGKHVAGGDHHAIQRFYKIDFPDRLLRRGHIKANVGAQWAEIADLMRAAVVERVLIALLAPPWNRK